MTMLTVIEFIMDYIFSNKLILDLIHEFLMVVDSFEDPVVKRIETLLYISSLVGAFFYRLLFPLYHLPHVLQEVIEVLS